MRNVHKQSFPNSFHRFDIRHLAGFPALATNRLIGFTASSMLDLFFDIFLYEYFGFRLWPVFVFYIISYIFRIPILIIAAKIFSRIGLTASMFIGTFAWIMFFVCVFVLDYKPDFAPLTLLIISAFSLSLFIAFYWSPFHVDFTGLSSKESRGKQIGILYALQRFLGFAAPIIGAIIITSFSFGAAFAVGIVIILLSLIPLVFLPRTSVQYEFGFLETFKKLFSKKYRYLTLSMVSYGADDFVGSSVWPIFLIIVFAGDYLDVGIFSVVIAAISIIIQLVLGRRLDKGGKRKFLKFGADLYALGWIGRSLVDTITGVFLASTFHAFGSIMMRTPADVIAYERAADSGHYVDEFTIIRELGLTIGRLGMAFVLIFITFYFSISAAFILAAVASFGVRLLSRFRVEEKI